MTKVLQENILQKKERFFEILYYGGNIMKNNQKLSSINQKYEPIVQPVDSGRSMVEMLGVLAVIGVLSIAGIAGYNAAMSKYQANKVANELNLISNQIQMLMKQKNEGQYELSLGALYEDGVLAQSGYEFAFGCGSDVEANTLCEAGETEYYEEVLGIPDSTCQSLAQLTQYAPNLVKQEVNGESDVIGSNCSGDNNSLVLYFDMDDFEVMEDEEDVTEIIPIENGKEVPEDAEIKCTTNEDCTGNQFCRTVSSTINVETIVQSECVPLDYGEAKGYAVSYFPPMNWWSAHRFCSAIGKRMLSYNDLNCADEIDFFEVGGVCHDTGKNYSSVISTIEKQLGSYSRGWISREGGDNMEYASYIFFPNHELTPRAKDNDDSCIALCI